MKKSVKKQKDPVEEEVEYSDVILLFCQHVIMTLSLEVRYKRSMARKNIFIPLLSSRIFFHNLSSFTRGVNRIAYYIYVNRIAYII